MRSDGKKRLYPSTWFKGRAPRAHEGGDTQGGGYWNTATQHVSAQANPPPSPNVQCNPCRQSSGLAPTQCRRSSRGGGCRAGGGGPRMAPRGKERALLPPASFFGQRPLSCGWSVIRKDGWRLQRERTLGSEGTLTIMSTSGPDFERMHEGARVVDGQLAAATDPHNQQHTPGGPGGRRARRGDRRRRRSKRGSRPATGRSSGGREGWGKVQEGGPTIPKWILDLERMSGG